MKLIRHKRCPVPQLQLGFAAISPYNLMRILCLVAARKAVALDEYMALGWVQYLIRPRKQSVLRWLAPYILRCLLQ